MVLRTEGQPDIGSGGFTYERVVIAGETLP